MLTGRPPFQAKTIVEICSQHLHEPPESPSAVRGQPISAELEAVVLACLAKKPVDRTASAAEVAARLARCPSATVWTQELAREWWKSYSELLRVDESAEVSADLSIDLAVRASVGAQVKG